MKRLLIIGLVLGALMVVPGGVSAATCPSSGGVSVAATAYVGGGAVWLESNDVPGLQQTYTTCSDGSRVPPDTQVASAGRCVGIGGLNPVCLL